MAFKHFWVQFKMQDISEQAYISSESFVIGRTPECELPIPTDVVSRRHIQVSLDGDTVYIKDLGSTNGTFLKGKRLVPNEEYEYKTGDRLYIDSGKEVSLRITAIFQEEVVDFELDRKGLELSKKQQELKNKKKNKNQVNENIVVSAAESVDNVFDNIAYIAKSARFNKEKHIKEAEHLAKELVEKAEEQVESLRDKVKQELEKLKGEAKAEAKAMLSQAQNKSKILLQKAESKASTMKQEAEEILDKSKHQAQEHIAQSMEKAQARHEEVIMQAHQTNTELKKQNQELRIQIGEAKSIIDQTERQTEKAQENLLQLKKLAEKANLSVESERENFKKIHEEVLILEDRKVKAMGDLESTVPLLEKRKTELETHLTEVNLGLLEKQELYKKILKDIEDKEQSLERVQSRSDQAEGRLDQLNQKLTEAEDQILKINDLRKQRHDELDSEIKERRERQDQIEQDANAKLSKAKEKSEKEIRVNIEAAKSKAQEHLDESYKNADLYKKKITAEADEYRDNVRKQADAYKARLSEEVEQWAADFKEEARSWAEATRQKAKDETDQIIASSERIRKEMEDEVAEKYSDIKKQSLLTKEEADLYSEKVRKEADEFSKKTKLEANTYSDELRAKAERETAEKEHQILKELDQKHKAISKEADKSAKEIISLAREQAEQEATEIRKKAVQSAEEMKRQLEIEESQRSLIRSKILNKELSQLLRTRIKPYLKDESHINKIDQLFDRTVKAVMLDEVDGEMLDAESFSDVDPSQAQKKVKNFYIYSGSAAVVLVLLLAFLPQFKQLAKTSGRNIAAVEEQQAKEKFEKVKKDNDLSKEFSPAKVNQYKDSYTDRVLYTKDYVKVELDKEYREQWIIELQDYFVHQLRLSENKLVPFIAHEANLIRELAEEMQKINGNFADKGIARMREIEKDFIKKIKSNIKSKKDFNKIMEFKKSFYQKNSSKY